MVALAVVAAAWIGVRIALGRSKAAKEKDDEHDGAA